MDCKTALAEAGGDVDRAIEVLRVKGQASAAKRSGRVTGEVDPQTFAMLVRPIPNGIRLAHQGFEVAVNVFTEAEAEAARLMPVGSKADTGKKLLCPMPGLVVSIAVTEGQEVKAGETLAVVEAMKMQNVLRAERDGTVKKIHAAAGATLAVDALILEFA